MPKESPEAELNVEDSWSSLETEKIRLEKAKLAVTALSAIATIITTVLVAIVSQSVLNARETNAQQQADAALQIRKQEEQVAAVTRKRIELWDKMARDVNLLYCYFAYVGRWKEIGPRDAIATKRALDETVYSYKPFFSQKFFDAYTNFIDSRFLSYQKWGEDAKLRTQNVRPLDKDEPSDAFTGERSEVRIFEAYNRLMNQMSDELAIPALKSGTAPKGPQ